MATSYTSLLGLALPVTGELSGTWGDTVNNSITALLDTAIAGTTTLSTDADVTLSTTTGATNQARQAILLCSGARTAQRTITAPAQSKIYVVINNTTGGFAVKLVGAGPTTGITIAAGKTAVVVWNGSDFVEVMPSTATTAINLTGGAAGSLPYQTGSGVTTMLAIGAANRVLTSSGTAPQWSSSLTGLASVAVSGNITGTSLTVHPSLIGKIDDLCVLGNTTGSVIRFGLFQGTSGFTNISTINFVSSGSSVRASIVCGESSGTYFSWSTENSSGVVAERLRLNNAGNLGIGISSPISRLTVYQSDAGTNDVQSLGQIWRGSSGTVAAGFGAAIQYTLQDAGGNNINTNGIQSIWENPAIGVRTASMVFLRSAANATFEAMRLDSSGNLGIGTSSPVNKLQVNGSIGRNAPATKTASFTLAATENWIICNGTASITVTLPAASSWTGREVMIKNVAAFTVVSASSNVVPLSGGAAGTAILPATAGAWATLVSDGSNWIIMQS